MYMKRFHTQHFCRAFSCSSMVKIFCFTILFMGCKNHGKVLTKTKSKPNFIIIFTDDQGYGDLSCFGGTHVHTPNIDKMAAEGMKLTSFYAAAPLCTPSRAALMTGSYPKRIDMATGSIFPVLLSGDTKGLHPDEITIAEVLRKAKYATGMFGKWHLGDQPEFLPTRQGFDEYFGIPYSHDIHPFHPRQDHFEFPSLALLEGEKIIEMDPDADYLTQRFTKRAVQFIEKNKEQPFFLYIAHPMPHHPIHVSPKFMEKAPDSLQVLLTLENESVNYTARGSLYPQAISEIDWSVGQIIETLVKYKLESNTLVIFTSDNGPDRAYESEPMGSAGPLKGRKGSTFEGGMREPTVVYWPEKIPSGQTSDELMTTMDLLPTFARLASAEIPSDRVIDGKDLWPTLLGKEKSPHEAFFYHKENELQAIRSGEWKLHVKKNEPVALFNISQDIGESKNLLMDNEDIVNMLLDRINKFQIELAENSRPAAFVKTPVFLKKK